MFYDMEHTHNERWLGCLSLYEFMSWFEVIFLILCILKIGKKHGTINELFDFKTNIWLFPRVPTLSFAMHKLKNKQTYVVLSCCLWICTFISPSHIPLHKY